MSALSKILSQKTERQLMYYIEHPEKHTEDAVLIALAELKSRSVTVPENIIEDIAYKINQAKIKKNPLSKETLDKIYYQSMIFCLVYVGLGTVSVLSLSPSSLLYGEWVLPAMEITIPVNLISFGVAYSDADATGLILIIQLITFLLLWLVVFNVLKSIKKRRVMNIFIS